MRAAVRVVLFALLLGLAQPPAEAAPPPAPDALDRFATGLLAKYHLPSLSLGILDHGALVTRRAYGKADLAGDRPATPDTIYLIASCSKPVVGLAVARAMELHPELTLDADVNTWLGWARPLRHPKFPKSPLTLRQLLRHESGLARDAPGDYDTYPKPDPDRPLDAFLQDILERRDSWLATAPGAAEAYSNLGAALVALVVEKVVHQPFDAFCQDALFGPLGMKDTAWKFGAFTASQRARVARPYDEDGKPYATYGFNDYPSGLLRTTVPDFARLLAMIAAHGRVGDTALLAPESVARFADVPFFIGVETDGGHTYLTHDGAESGVMTEFALREDGAGYIYFINGELDSDADSDAVEAALERRLMQEAARAARAPRP